MPMADEDRRIIRTGAHTVTFEIMAYVIAVAGAGLGIRFIFFGSSVLGEWNLDPTDGALLMCRRYGLLYLGLAIMFLLGRNAPPSDLRSAVCVGIGAGTALLAANGFWELRAGRVSRGIIGPAVVEAVVAAGFAWAFWNGLS
jgi:hypothetical protein